MDIEPEKKKLNCHFAFEYIVPFAQLKILKYREKLYLQSQKVASNSYCNVIRIL